jgi:hypothetical protein
VSKPIKLTAREQSDRSDAQRLKSPIPRAE